MRSMILACVMAAVLLGNTSCASLRLAKPSPPSSAVILHLDYRSGGDSPIGYLLTFYEDGEIRYYSPRRTVHWVKIHNPEGAQLEKLLNSPKFQNDLKQVAAASRPFACCGRHEVGIYMSAVAEPIALDFDFRGDQSLQELVDLVNRIGKAYFGGRFRPQLPLN